MSYKTQQRRIHSLERRIAGEDKKAHECEGLSGGYCTYTLPDREPPFNHVTSTNMCYNHSNIAKYRYEDMVRTLAAIKARLNDSSPSPARRIEQSQGITENNNA